MAKICPVCGNEVGFFDGGSVGGDVYVHGECREKYNTFREEYNNRMKAESSNQNEAIDEKQASIKTNTSGSTSFNGATNKVQVTNFDMPFGDMVYFIIKWSIASIPALIILFIIGLIFFGIFGALFF